MGKSASVLQDFWGKGGNVSHQYQKLELSLNMVSPVFQLGTHGFKEINKNILMA
jgi:hypothetical protein